MEPVWLRLLRSVEPPKTGFTIPYLVGASLFSQGHPSASEAQCYREFIDTLVAMRERPIDSKFVRIARCTGHGEPIASLRPSGEVRHGQAVLSESGHERLFVAKQYFSGSAQTIDAVSTWLWAYHEDAITSGRYSYAKKEKEYCAFSAKELESIAAVLNGGQG